MSNELLDDPIYSYTAIVHFVMYSTICGLGLLGIIGNVLSIAIWTRPELKSRTAILLTALGFSDMIFVLSLYPKLYVELSSLYRAITTTTEKEFTEILYRYHYLELNYMAEFAYPVACIAQTMSIYMTLAVTVERYIAVCYPFQYEEICSYSRILKATAAITFFAILYNLPRFWFGMEFLIGSRTSFSDPFDYFLNPYDLSKKPHELYLIWLELFIVYLLPLAAITIWNITICIKLKMASRKRRGMTSHQDLTAHQKRENKLTIMLIYVVFEFIICFSVNGFTSLKNAIHATQFTDIDITSAQDQVSLNDLALLHETLRPVGVFFDLLNASANFLSYVTFGQPFRKTLIETLCCCRHQQERRQESSTNHSPNFNLGENPNNMPMVTL